MSTKIFHGWKIDSPNILEVHDILKRVKIKATDAITDYIKKKMIKEAVILYDKQTIGLESAINGSSPMTEIFMRFLKGESEAAKSIYKSPYDFTLNVTVFPRQHDMLAMTFAQYEDIYNPIFEEEPSISEYKYWNNTDRPNDISDQEWSQREYDWDSAVYNGIPAESGFAITLVSGMPVVPSANLLSGNDIPDIDDRINSIAEYAACKEWGREWENNNGNNVVSSYMKWRFSDDFKNKIAILKKSISLKQDLTIDDLYNNAV